jgi:glycosyltransferase involved in cell wall biosynthesis
MNTVPRLSIGFPVYNGEKFLSESLDALLGQTYEDFELIISDNASTDRTADICLRYAKEDSRIRYVRQPRNIGAAPNHNFLFQQSRGELFKWASADDLYARDLLERCVDALDKYPDAVLAHSWTAAVNSAGKITQALGYPLATDSPRAPERFWSLLFGCSGIYKRDGRTIRLDNNGAIRADDMYAVIRTNVMRQVAPHGSYWHADRILPLELALHGPFYQIPEWLYFRRDHSDRGSHSPTIRAWSVWLDPRRANRLRYPIPRLYAEYIWGYIGAIQRAPLSHADRRECYGYLAQWIVNRAMNSAFPKRLEPNHDRPSALVNNEALSVAAIVAGQERKRS